MTFLKIFFGVAALFLAWALLYRTHLIYTFNRWMREYAFSDQWVLFSGRRIAVLFFVFGCLALFSGLDHVVDTQKVSPKVTADIFEAALKEFNSHQYEAAIRRCKVLIDLDPHFLQARELLAACWILSGHPQKATQEIDLILKINPNYIMTEGPLKKLLERKITS